MEAAFGEGDDGRVEALSAHLEVVAGEQRDAGYYLDERPARERRRMVTWLRGEPARRLPRSPRSRGGGRPPSRARARRPRCVRRRRSDASSSDSPDSGEAEHDPVDHRPRRRRLR
jgi:hypothetical protein